VISIIIIIIIIFVIFKKKKNCRSVEFDMYIYAATTICKRAVVISIIIIIIILYFIIKYCPNAVTRKIAHETTDVLTFP